MALPTTITSIDLAPLPAHSGPFKSSGGAFYFIARDSTNTERLVALKATDPTSSFSEQDSANRPNAGSLRPALCIDVIQNGDDLHVIWDFGDVDVNNILYSRFDMSTDAWQDVSGTDKQVNVEDQGPGHLTANALKAAVARRSDGDLVVAGAGIVDKNMGTDYDRVDFFVSTDNGATWSAPVQVFGASNDQIHYRAPEILLGDSDTTHIFGTDGTNLLQRALSSADALQTERDTGFDVASIVNPIGPGVSFDRGGTTKLRVPYKDVDNDLGVLEFDAAADPSAFTSSEVSADEPQVDNASVNACLALDGSTVHALFVKVADDDLYSADDGDSDTWTTPASTFVGTVNHVSANVYDRSGAKLAHLIDDGGTVKYDEDELGAAGTTVTLGLASETDTAFGVTSDKVWALGLASEAAVAHAMIAERARTLALAGSTATAHAMGFAKVNSLGLAAETNTAQAMTAARSREVGLASTLSAAHAVNSTKGALLGLAAEAGAAQPVGRLKGQGLGLSTEADAAQPVAAGKAQPIGLASTDAAAQPVSGVKGIALGLATAVDTAHALGRLKEQGLGLAGETDAAFALSTVTVVAVGQASETDSGFAVDAAKLKALGQALASDVAHAVTAARAHGIGLAAEGDSAQSVAPGRAHALGLAPESDIAFALGTETVVALGLASETETAFALSSAKAMALGLATETDAALAVLPARTLAIGLAGEADEALAVQAARDVALGLAAEVDAALALDHVRAVPLGLAGEADSAFAVVPLRLVVLGQAGETDEAFAITAELIVFFANPLHTIEARRAAIIEASGDRSIQARHTRTVAASGSRTIKARR